MKTIIRLQYVIAFLSFVMFINACSDESNFTNLENNIQQNTIFLSQEKEALLFMLEEEKLARDTYQYLNCHNAQEKDPDVGGMFRLSYDQSVEDEQIR